jgi:hypothetical protein
MNAVLEHPGPVAAEPQETAPVTPERQAGPIKQSRLRRRRPLSGLAGHAPATVCYLAAVWAAGLATGSIVHGPPGWLSGHVGAGAPSLGHGYWWTPLSAGCRRRAWAATWP